MADKKQPYNWNRVKPGDIVSFRYKSKSTGKTRVQSLLVLNPKLNVTLKDGTKTKHLIGIIEIPKLKKGNTVNYAEDEGLELLAKGITGWGAMAIMFGPAAEKRLAMGFK